MSKRSRNPRKPSAIKRAEEYIRQAQARVERLDRRPVPVQAPQRASGQGTPVTARARGGGSRRFS